MKKIMKKRLMDVLFLDIDRIIPRRNKKIRSKELRMFSYQMYTMISAGINVYEAIDILSSSYNKNFGKILGGIGRSISSGKSLSESLLITNSFSNFFVNMVYAGESSGDLDLVFKEMARYYEREEKLRKKIIEAMIYPLMLTVIGFIAFNFIILFVIPSFEEIISVNSQGNSSNVYNKWIFVFSRFLRGNFFEFYVFLFMTLLLLVILFRKIEGIDYHLEKALFRLSATKKVIQTLVTERFSRSLSILIRSSVNIEESIEISIKVINMSYFERCMKLTSSSIRRGMDISSSISLSGIFPKMYIDMIKVGERTGMLADSLDSINTYYSEELDSMIDTIIKLIEPTMILVFGILIGVLVISIISPMYDMMSTLGG